MKTHCFQRFRWIRPVWSVRFGNGRFGSVGHVIGHVLLEGLILVDGVLQFEFHIPSRNFEPRRLKITIY
jgi:hypothetical protein